MSSISSEDTSRNEDSSKIKDKSNLHKTTLLNSESKSINSPHEKVMDLKNVEIKTEDLIPDINKSGENKKPTKNIVSGCAHCGKKLKLIESSIGKCRCEKIFCSKHRYPESHVCDFDWREMSRKTLQVKNQRVVADKLESRI